MIFSLDRWAGKVAVVTGASVGIGAAICRQLVEHGVIVAGFARRLVKVEILAKELGHHKGKLIAVKCDVSSEADIIKAFEHVKETIGPIHILVNNAGINRKVGSTLTSGDVDEWRQLFDINVLGLCICTREAIRSMNENNVAGHIIHINSIVGHRVPHAPDPLSVYPASKYAVTALTETLRHELNRDKAKIKITSVSPGIVKTEFMKASGHTKESAKHALKGSPHLEPEDIADAVVYALSTPPHVQISELTVQPVNQPF